MTIDKNAGWLEDQQKWLEQHREKTIQETGKEQKSLAKSVADQCQAKAENKIIKNPGMFIKELNKILNEIRETASGAAQRLKHRIVEFLNEFMTKVRRGDAQVPAEFQIACLKDAAEFDNIGNIVKGLCGVFAEQYESTIRRRLEAAILLRKIAALLEKRAA